MPTDFLSSTFSLLAQFRGATPTNLLPVACLFACLCTYLHVCLHTCTNSLQGSHRRPHAYTYAHTQVYTQIFVHAPKLVARIAPAAKRKLRDENKWRDDMRHMNSGWSAVALCACVRACMAKDALTSARPYKDPCTHISHRHTCKHTRACTQFTGRRQWRTNIPRMRTFAHTPVRTAHTAGTICRSVDGCSGSAAPRAMF